MQLPDDVEGWLNAHPHRKISLHKVDEYYRVDLCEGIWGLRDYAVGYGFSKSLSHAFNQALSELSKQRSGAV